MGKLETGMMFPNFNVTTQYEDATSISAIAGNKPLMVVVLRYIGCTSCRYDVHMIQKNYQRFVDKGVNVAVVMQSPVSTIRRDLAEEPLSFPIISDVDYEIYHSLEIRPAADMAQLIGSEEDKAKFMKKREDVVACGFTHGDYEGIEEQLPAFFYLEKDLTVKVAHYGRSIGDMPDVEEMLAM